MTSNLRSYIAVKPSEDPAMADPCQPITTALNELVRRIRALQTQFAQASPAERGAIQDEIDGVRDQINVKQSELDACRSINPKPLSPDGQFTIGSCLPNQFRNLYLTALVSHFRKPPFENSNSFTQCAAGQPGQPSYEVTGIWLDGFNENQIDQVQAGLNRHVGVLQANEFYAYFTFDVLSRAAKHSWQERPKYLNRNGTPAISPDGSENRDAPIVLKDFDMFLDNGDLMTKIGAAYRLPSILPDVDFNITIRNKFKVEAGIIAVDRTFDADLDLFVWGNFTGEIRGDGSALDLFLAEVDIGEGAKIRFNYRSLELSSAFITVRGELSIG
jgi:hypothetical protein